MRKILICTLMMMVVIGLFGCSGGLPNDIVSMTCSQPEYVNRIDIYSETGNKFVIINVEVTNKGKDNHHANPNNFTLVDTEGYSYPYDVATHALDRKQFPAVDVRPENKVTGHVVFKMPNDAEVQKLIYKPLTGKEVVVSF